MNYNDINIRLKRIYASIDKQNKYGPEVLRAVKTEVVESPDKKSGKIIFSFGGDEKDPDTLNQIHSVVSNLANLKDCLKDRMVEQGKDPGLIESDIDQSLSLRLILDLGNQEKHGYPLTKSRRSEQDPMIVNVAGAIGPSDKPDGITHMGSDGAMALNIMLSIHADITDSKGKHLCSLDQLVNQAIKDWEAIIEKHQIV